MGRSAVGGGGGRGRLQQLIHVALDTTRELVLEWGTGRRWALSVRRVVKRAGLRGQTARSAAGIALSGLAKMGLLVKVNGGRAKKKYVPTEPGLAWARRCSPGNCGGCRARRCPYGYLDAYLRLSTSRRRRRASARATATRPSGSWRRTPAPQGSAGSTP
jgi:hypothetical protein